MTSPKPMPPADAAAAQIADIKRRQLQQYLYCPGRIPTAVHPFVKQMPLQSRLHRYGLIRVMLSGFAVMSSLGVLALVRPLRLLFGRPSGRSHRVDQGFIRPALPGSTGGSEPPVATEALILDTSCNNSNQ